MANSGIADLVKLIRDAKNIEVDEQLVNALYVSSWAASGWAPSPWRRATGEGAAQQRDDGPGAPSCFPCLPCRWKEDRGSNAVAYCVTAEHLSAFQSHMAK